LGDAIDDYRVEHPDLHKRIGTAPATKDDADELPTVLQSVLRTIVSEAGAHPIAVITSSREPIDVPGAEQVKLERLEDRDVRRLLAPIIADGVNPEPAISKAYAASGGNPLWLHLVLVSWIQSGKLRLVHGRPYFDDRVVTHVPESVQETVRGIVGKLSPAELHVVEGLAVWSRPMSTTMAESLFDVTQLPEELVERNSVGIRLVADSVREVLLESLSPEHRREWHARILKTSTRLVGDRPSWSQNCRTR
jgi:hypothetical protein